MEETQILPKYLLRLCLNYDATAITHVNEVEVNGYNFDDVPTNCSLIVVQMSLVQIMLPNHIIKIFEQKGYKQIKANDRQYILYFTKSVGAVTYNDVCYRHGPNEIYRPSDCTILSFDDLRSVTPCIINAYNPTSNEELNTRFTFEKLTYQNFPDSRYSSYYVMDTRLTKTKAAVHKK